MASQLRDLKVDFISLVDKAAVRDPKDPTKPRRFLLWKAEDGAPLNNEEKTMIDTQDCEIARARLDKGEDASRVLADLNDPVRKAELRKAELLGVNSNAHQMSGRASDLDPSPSARKAAAKARAALAGHEDDPTLGSLVSHLEAFSDDPEDPFPGDRAGRELAGIQKAAAELDLSPSARERVAKAERGLERAYLRSVNPIALEKFENGTNSEQLQEARERAGLPRLVV